MLRFPLFTLGHWAGRRCLGSSARLSALHGHPRADPQRPVATPGIHSLQVNLTHRPVPNVAGPGDYAFSWKQGRIELRPVARYLAVLNYQQYGNMIELTYLENELAIYIIERKKILDAAHRDA